MVSMSSSQVLRKAESIPLVTADEAYSLLKAQLERFMTLLDTLEPADWTRPTACTEWTVREIVAHQAGGYASGTGYREMIRQYSTRPKRGQLPEDAINALQVRERAERTPEELVAELRAAGPIAIQKWAYQFRIGKLLAFPHPIAGLITLRYLMWTTHSRETWMHRLDICRATGRPFEQTADQDGRIVELVMLDVAKILRRKLGTQTGLFELTGIAGGAYQIGAGEPAVTVQMDALDFNIFTSGRFKYEEARERATISGDAAFADQVLKNLLILY